jgi:CheY-like chemotaxis protein
VAKRALIVDDSKSARLSLARTLEKHAIEVDTAESAEQAIEYLWTHRPDAIFMDHNMPGMDGLQAVQAIKNNPRTATIPIMMYTSQEGELYVGQARALGAIGVLPKQIRPTDVAKVLYQLNLAVDRRSNEQHSFHPAPSVDGSAESDQGHTHAHVQTHPLVHALDSTNHGAGLREQLTDLRRTVLSGFDAQGDRLLADMRAALHELHPPTVAAVVPPRRPWLPWGLAAALAGACVLLLVLFWQQGSRLADLQDQLAALKATAQQDSAAPASPSAVPVSPPPPADAAAAPPPPTADAAAVDPASGDPASAPRTSPKPIIQMVPYGAEPFSGSRLDAIRQLFDRLTAQGFQGLVDIRTYSGRFCLVGNATEGYSPAPDDLPYARCDTVSSAHDDAATGSMRIPVAMADLVGSVRASSRDLIRVQITGGEGGNFAGYPAQSDALTAGEWNRAASANNRIEIHVR